MVTFPHHTQCKFESEYMPPVTPTLAGDTLCIGLDPSPLLGRRPPLGVVCYCGRHVRWAPAVWRPRARTPHPALPLPSLRLCPLGPSPLPLPVRRVLNLCPTACPSPPPTCCFKAPHSMFALLPAPVSLHPLRPRGSSLSLSLSAVCSPHAPQLATAPPPSPGGRCSHGQVPFRAHTGKDTASCELIHTPRMARTSSADPHGSFV
jgi:hypothetical protein